MQREERYAFDRQKPDALTGHRCQRGNDDVAAGQVSGLDGLRHMRQAPTLERALDQWIAGIQAALFVLFANRGNGNFDEASVIKAVQRGHFDLTILRQQP